MKKNVERLHVDSIFWLLVSGSFVVLLFYRIFVHLPVWFDEIFAKAFIFGAPVWLYALVGRQTPDFFGFERRRFWPGAYAGLAIGGIFGFIGLMTSTVQKGRILIPYLFSSSTFWETFGLAFATAWWESVFFYGLILSVLQHKHKNEWKAAALTTIIFLSFHAPVLVVRGGLASAAVPLFLLSFFAFGQAIIFMRTKSVASAVVSHAFWGMVLLVYTSR